MRDEGEGEGMGEDLSGEGEGGGGGEVEGEAQGGPHSKLERQAAGSWRLLARGCCLTSIPSGSQKPDQLLLQLLGSSDGSPIV